MAITPSTSVQSFNITRCCTTEAYGGDKACPSSIYLEVQHKIVSTTSNSTNLEIKLILHHAQIDLDAGSNDCAIIINGTPTEWTGPNLYSNTSGATTTLGTKTIKVPHDSNGTFSNKSFIVRYRMRITYSGSYIYFITNYNTSTQNTITLPALYSACTAPTTVSVTSPAKPGNITITWSGAAAGTNNAISKYRVYYAIGSSPTTSSSYQETTNATASLTFNASSRGSTYYFKVLTIGSVSGYNSGLSSAQATCVINQLPNAPTLNKSSQTIVSTSTGVSVTAAAGAANAGFSSTSVYYATSSTGTKSKYTSAITINPSAGYSSTYYFWTWDGAEYSSSSTSITITKNTKPSINSISATVGTFTALGTSSASSQFQGWADYMTPTVTTNKTGTINRTIELMRTNSIVNFSVEKTNIYSSETIATTSSTTLSKITPYTAISKQYGSTINSTYKYIAWRIKYTLSDGLETSDPVYYPTNTNYFYAIPGMATVSSVQCLDGVSNKLFKRVKFTLYNETAPSGTTSLSTLVSATIDGQTVEVTKTEETTSGSNRLITVTLTNAPPSDKAVIFTITYLRGGLAKTTTQSVQSRTTPGSLGNLSISRDTVKPFSESDNIEFSATWPFIDSDISSYATDYNISSINIAFSNNDGSATRSGTITKDGSYLKVTINANSIYDWTSSWGITSYAGIYSFSAKISITSGYGETFTSGTQTFKLNFNEPISDLKITNFYRVYSTSSLTSMYSPPATPSGTATMDSIGFAQNNVGCIALSYSGYTRDTCTVEVYFDGSVIKTFTISNAGQSGHASYNVTHDGNNLTTIIISNEKFTIPEITKAKTPVKIVITNNYGQSTFEIDGGMNTVRQTTPIMALTSLEIDNNEFSGRLTISDLGVSSNGQTNPYAVSDGSSLYSGAFSVTGTGSSYTFSGVARTGTDFDSKSLTLRFTSKVTIYSNSSTSTTTSSKNYYLNYITVYKASPTVAYRKNAIGINTSSPKSGAALDVHNSSTTSNVYFQGLNALWTFNIESGTVQFNSNTPLDLKNLLTTAGAITDNTVIATNDRIVFSDDSDSGKLKRSTIVFDTTVTNKYLSQAGTWADSLSTTTLTATGEISGASITTTGNGSIGNNLNVDGSILFEEREQTGHKYIYFANAASSTNHHDMAIYGGGPSSVNAFGIWDISQGSPYYWPFLYRDANKEIMLDVSSSDYSKGYLADFPIEVKKDTTTGLYYKKWHSGLGEVFGRIKILGSEVTESTESGGVYYSNTIYVDLPLTFKYVSGSQNDDICMVLSGGSYLTWAANTGLTNSGSRIAFRLLRAVPLSSSIDYGMYLHVQGPLAGSSTGSTIYTDRTFSG